MRLFLLPVLLLASCYASAPQGGGHFGPLPGESILTVAGSISSQEPDVGDTTDTVIAQVGIGHFLDEVREVGGQILIANSSSGNFESEVLGLLPYFNWNFRQSEQTWFYAGPHAGLIEVTFSGGGFNESETELSYGVHGGMRQWVTSRSAFYIEPRITKSSKLDDFTILFGINFAL
ncbi:MAG: hypothetical protein ACI8TQ_003060 [Planctomycetota bacterium]|jgi:hypothetical protein